MWPSSIPPSNIQCVKTTKPPGRSTRSTSTKKASNAAGDGAYRGPEKLEWTTSKLAGGKGSGAKMSASTPRTPRLPIVSMNGKPAQSLEMPTAPRTPYFLQSTSASAPVPAPRSSSVRTARFFLDFGKRNLIAEETHAVIAAAVNAVLNPWRAPDSVVLALADALDGGSSRFREQEGGDREPSVLDEVQRASVIRTLEDALGHAIAAYAAQREGENVADAGKILATALRAMWCVGPGV